MTAAIDAIRISVTDDERDAGALGPERLEAARRAVLDDGLVVLDDLVPVPIVESLAARMYADLPALIEATKGRAGYAGQLQQPPPTDPEHLHPEVLANPIVIDLCKALLGPSLVSTFYAANVNMPGSVRQAVHCDLPQLWPDLDPVHAAPYALACNLPLVDTTEHTATELWPGTHLDGRTHTRERLHRDIPLDWLEERRQERPPVQVPQRKGSVVLRDVRVWHTGVANSSEETRTMIGVGYAASWYGGFVIPVPDPVATVLTDLGLPPVTRVDGTRAFSKQLIDSVRGGLT